MVQEFERMRHPELAAAIERRALVLVPFGQTEEHGPHLPVYTDWLIARRVSEAAAERVGEEVPTVLMNGIMYGYSTEHLTHWPGTIRLHQEIVVGIVRDLCASLGEMGFRKIILVSNHGHHYGLVRMVIRRLWDENRLDVAAVFPYNLVGDVFNEVSKAGPEGSCHAGEFETSVMLHLVPEDVDMSDVTSNDRLTAGHGFPSSGVFWSTWNRQQSQSGVYGDPTVASAETGKRLFEAMVEQTAQFMKKYYQGSASSKWD